MICLDSFLEIKIPVILLNVILFGVSLAVITPIVYAEDLKILHRYQLNEGVAEDIETGLMWMRCSLGQTWDGWTCQGKEVGYVWEQAMTLQNFKYAGYNDWRLPTIDELKSLVYCSNGKTKLSTEVEGERECAEPPAILQSVFPNTSYGDFWSSSPSTVDQDSQWLIQFYSGLAADNYFRKGNSFYIRLVRVGQ